MRDVLKALRRRVFTEHALIETIDRRFNGIHDAGRALSRSRHLLRSRGESLKRIGKLVENDKRSHTSANRENRAPINTFH